MRNKTIGAVLLTLTASAAHAYTSADYLWKTYNGHQYAATLDYSNWAQAEAWAVEVGGHLATINDANENAWLAETFKGTGLRSQPSNSDNSLVWIGLWCIGEETDPADWQWVSGQSLTYSPPWYSGVPHFDPWGSDYAYLHTNTHHQPGTWWNNGPIEWLPELNPYGIIEVDSLSPAIPAPGALVLGAIGVGLVNRLRRRRAI